MQSDRDLLRQALGYMESVGQMDMHPEEWAIAVALRERLAQPEQDGACGHCAGSGCIACDARHLPEPQQEPVAMRYDFDGYGYRYIDSGSGSNWQTRIKDAEPLYAAPQQSDTKVNFEAIPKQVSEPVQEPVAWLHRDYYGNLKVAQIEPPPPLAFPVYTAPPRQEQPEQEPVAWISKHGVVYPLDAKDEVHPINDIQPLYTTPPRREWQGLTEEEIRSLNNWWPSYDDRTALMVLIRDAEAKLKEKNA